MNKAIENEWPEKFSENIYVDDPAFARPEQGIVPPAPELESETIQLEDDVARESRE